MFIFRHFMSKLYTNIWVIKLFDDLRSQWFIMMFFRDGLLKKDISLKRGCREINVNKLRR